jgi:type II secretory pathway pseudopilin PulG
MRRSGWPESQAGFLVLIELLVAVLLIAAVVSYYYGSSRTATETRGGASEGPHTVPGMALQRAKGVECQNMLQQFRAAIATYQANSGAYPPDLAGLQTGLSATCSAGNEAYEYDPDTGRVRCPHAGHEMY